MAVAKSFHSACNFEANWIHKDDSEFCRFNGDEAGAGDDEAFKLSLDACR